MTTAFALLLSLRLSLDIRTVSDGRSGDETFAVACAWLRGRPETMTCRQFHVERKETR